MDLICHGCTNTSIELTSSINNIECIGGTGCYNSIIYNNKAINSLDLSCKGSISCYNIDINLNEINEININCNSDGSNTQTCQFGSFNIISKTSLYNFTMTCSNNFSCYKKDCNNPSNTHTSFPDIIYSDNIQIYCNGYGGCNKLALCNTGTATFPYSDWIKHYSNNFRIDCKGRTTCSNIGLMKYGNTNNYTINCYGKKVSICLIYIYIMQYINMNYIYIYIRHVYSCN